MKHIKFWIGIIISVGLLWWAFSRVEVNKVVFALQNAEYLYLIPGFFFTILAYFFRVLRWRVLLEPIKKIGFHSLFAGIIIGFMVNNLLPARIGEFIRAYVIGKKEGISKSISFATIVLERVFDGLMIIFFLTIIIIFLPLSDQMKKAGYFTAIFYLGALIFLIGLKIYTDKVLSICQWILTPLGDKLNVRITKGLKSFVSGLAVLGSLRHIINISIYSFLVWLTSGFIFYFFLLAFDIQQISAAFFCMVITCIWLMLPAAPGFVGTFQMGCIMGLGIFGVQKDIALSYSLLLHISQYIPVTIIGLIYLWKEHIHLSEIKKET